MENTELKTEGLNFQEAYAAMRAGNKIRRHNSKGYWSFNKETGTESITLPMDGKEINYGKLGLTMKACSCNDWEIVPSEEGVHEYKVNPTKFSGMNFSDAYKAMKSGAKVRRHGFNGFWAISEETGEEYVVLPGGKFVTYGKLGLTMRSCSCNDWEIVDETPAEKDPLVGTEETPVSEEPVATETQEAAKA